MEDKNEQHDHGLEQKHGWHGTCCHDGHHHKHFLLRLILGLVILGIVFGVGIKIGEFKGELEAGGFGYGDHYDKHMRFFGPMMQRNLEYRIPTSTPR